MKDQLVNIYSYLHGMWRYRWSALAISWVVAVLGWAVVYALPNQYTAQAVMYVDTKSIMRPLLEGLTVESDIDDSLNIMSRILLNRDNLEAVARQTDIYMEAADPQDLERHLEKMAGSILLEEEDSGRRKRSNVYALSYEGESPDLVYQVVSKLLNTLIETTLDSARTDAAAAQQFLDRQIKEYESRLSVSEQRLAEFKRTNVGFMPDEKGGYYSRLQREQAELDSTKSDLVLAKRRLAEMQKQLRGEKPLLDSNSYGSTQMLKLREYQEQLETLLTQYTEGHPDVQALRAAIADLLANDSTETDVALSSAAGDSLDFNPVYQELKSEIHKASVEVETLKIELATKEKSVEELKQSIHFIPDVEAELVKLNRDYEITRERYLDLVERREAAILAQEVGQSSSDMNFRIIDPPRVPIKPSGPDRALLLTLVLIAAIAAGLGWGYLRYLMHPTFINSSQIREKIGLPLLGSVGLYLTTMHKVKRQMQLLVFAMVFLLLTSLYAGSLLFVEPGSQLVSGLLLQYGIKI